MTKILSGSIAKRRINCHGSYAWERGKPDTVSDFAAEGTMLHELMHRILKTDIHHDAFIGSVVNDIEVTREHIYERIVPALDATDELVERYGSFDYFTEREYKYDVLFEAESTADLVGRSADTLIVADYKFGQGVKVDARENYQLAFYALGALLNERMAEGAERIALAIIQPFDGEARLDVWETDHLWLDLFKSVAVEAYERIKNGSKTLKAGEWCRFCKGRALCPETNNDLIHLSRMSVQDLTTSVDLAALFNMVEKVKALLPSAERVLEDYAIKQGVNIPGTKVIQGYSHRKWTDETQAVKAMAVAGIDPFQPQKVLTAPMAEKKIGKKRFADEFGHLVGKDPTKLKLVREDDKRPAIDVGPSPDAVALISEVGDIQKP